MKKSSARVTPALKKARSFSGPKCVRCGTPSRMKMLVAGLCQSCFARSR